MVAGVEIFAKKEIFEYYIFKGFAVSFQYPRFDGTLSEKAEHFVIERGESVGILVHDVPANEIVLVEQFRIATAENGPGFMIELPAGRIDSGEDPLTTAARETKEETGAVPGSLEHISTFYLSSGGLAERLHLFYAPFPEGLTVGPHGGLAHEGEDLKIHRLSLIDAYEMISSGKIVDAKTIIAIQWLMLKALKN